MLSQSQEKLIKSLHTNKGRLKTNLWLVEGSKFLELAGRLVQTTFTANDTPRFSQLTTTDTPPAIAGLAQPPHFQLADVLAKDTVLLLDNVQDPGNLGTIIRLAAAFDAGLLFCRCVDPGNPKTIRSSAGTVFQTPWLELTTQAVQNLCQGIDRPIYRLENTPAARPITTNQATNLPKQILLVVGSEGQGITLPIAGQSIFIKHQPLIDSINVATAVAIALFIRYQKG